VRKLYFVFSVVILTGLHIQAQSLSEKRVIQFTGVVFTGDSATVIPGVHIYLPKGGRGTTSNPYGFFSMPAVEGDSIVFSAVGFERTYYVVPKHELDHSLKLLVYLTEDITYLEEVAVFPYPSEATFKAAVLAVQLPDGSYGMSEWLNSEIMRSMYWRLPASGNENHRYFMQEQMNYNNYRNGPASNALLNPFAWNTFIRSLKKK
jgi:hypothetical protein